MKKIFTTALMAVAAMFATATAQNAPNPLNGYFRLTNAAFQEALTVDGKYDFTGTVPSPTNAGSIFRIKTGEMASIQDEMDKLDQLLQSGAITQAEWFQRFMQLLSSGNTWYYGCFPLEQFSSQGVDYVEMIKKLPDYADIAIENFINNDAAGLYDEHINELRLLCVFATEIIKPGNIEDVSAFKKWCESYLTAWRNSTVFDLYMQPVYTVDDPEDEEAVSQFTGEYYFRFHTPTYVGNMQKAQIYINNIITDNGNIATTDTLDLWGSAKRYIMEAIAEDYPQGTPAYAFVKGLFEDTYMDMDYIIGESEEGGLKFQPLPNTFNGMEGYDGPNITITADDIARCTWKIEAVDKSSPFAIAPNPLLTDGMGNYYSTLYTAFPYEISAGMTAFYATAVNFDGVPEMVEINGKVVAAETPVIIRSTSVNMADNKIVPLFEGGSEISGNVLKGVLFSMPNDGHMVTLGAKEKSPVFSAYHVQFPANTAYYDGDLAGVGAVGSDAEGDAKMYDLMGREVKDPNARGIFIVNGRKVVRF